MNRGPKENRFRTRGIAACTCLLALLFVYAPMASATWMAVTGSCCAGDQCPIHGNHHSSQKNDDAAIDCGHSGHNMSKMAACAISCCNTVEQAAVHAHFFLLTPLAVSIALAPLYSASPVAAPANISPAFAPLGPPPKSAAISI